jgi:hypothetical protein
MAGGFWFNFDIKLIDPIKMLVTPPRPLHVTELIDVRN